jgi:hypothetical protein
MRICRLRHRSSYLHHELEAAAFGRCCAAGLMSRWLDTFGSVQLASRFSGDGFRFLPSGTQSSWTEYWPTVGSVDVPFGATVVGTPVTVLRFDFDGNERRGLTAQCHLADGSRQTVSAADIRLPGVRRDQDPQTPCFSTVPRLRPKHIVSTGFAGERKQVLRLSPVDGPTPSRQPCVWQAELALSARCCVWGGRDWSTG